MKIVLTDLPKISLNKWYAGNHWTKRAKLKEAYKWTIAAQTKIVFSKHDTYNVTYDFEFRTRPLDATNTVAMVKMIEDILFEDDKYNVVLSVRMTSRKSNKDQVTICIE
jgi:hypothetical protein